MKSLIPLLLLLIIPMVLPCVEPVLPIPMGDGAGSAPPPPPDNLLQEAYQSMLRGDYATAEVQYRSATILHPENQDVWEGLLWAQNSLGKYRLTLKDSQKLLRQHPERQAIYAYQAYALQQLGRYPEARYAYLQSLTSTPENAYVNALNMSGLATVYRSLDDYHLGRELAVRSASLRQLPPAAEGIDLLSSVYYKLPGEHKSALGVSQRISHRAYSLSLAHERFQLNSAYFRSVSSAGLSVQVPHLKLKADGRYLQGKDGRIYPARQAGLNAEPLLYYKSLAFRPGLYVSYSHYPRFDAQQFSISPSLLWRDLNLSYSYHHVYIDNEPAATDSTHISQQVTLTKRIPWGMTLGVHYGSGNYTWLIDKEGACNDTFNRNGTYYGASLLAPIYNRVYLYALHQRWQDDALWYASLAVRY